MLLVHKRGALLANLPRRHHTRCLPCLLSLVSSSDLPDGPVDPFLILPVDRFYSVSVAISQAFSSTYKVALSSERLGSDSHAKKRWRFEGRFYQKTTVDSSGPAVDWLYWNIQADAASEAISFDSGERVLSFRPSYDEQGIIVKKTHRQIQRSGIYISHLASWIDYKVIWLVTVICQLRCM
ncbi:unnamed protein product [Protopolystoma xenopodis]|uniref:Uncharacterized protein n=1 Tax=Protopolystoma xenopodis TaxID=117903 RepID=A0A3S5AI51_9PLAT|nr:unnamed protein product [Protopolystoma xenopodis]